jgi:hypothetical protein
MMEQPNRLPLAQYLRLFELARELDSRIFEDISLESIEGDIQRQLEAILPSSDLSAGPKSSADLKQEEEAISRILDTIRDEIRPAAARLSPGFVDRLQARYQEQWDTIQNRLKLSVQLDEAYRDSREEETQAFQKKKEILLEAQQAGVGLQSVTDLAHEIERLEEAQGEIETYQKSSAQEWAALAEQQIDEQKAQALWEKAIQRDNSPELCDRRDKHMAALGELGEEAVQSYVAALKGAQEVYERVAQGSVESSSNPENDLRLALEKCEYVVAALSEYPYPSVIGGEARKLQGQIVAYNNLTWQSQVIGWIAQAEVDLAGEDLEQANKDLAYAKQALARIWDAELQASLGDKLEAVQQKIEAKAGQRVERVMDNWRQQAQTYLDRKDAIAALDCVYAAKALTHDVAPRDELLHELAALESEALAILPREINVDAGSLADHGKQLLSQGDRQPAFRWLEAALQLDARSILSDPSFAELIDQYFEFRSKRDKLETLLFQAEFRLAQDARDSEHMAVAEGLLGEARQLLEQVGETDRLAEIDEKRNTLQRLHREALTEELNDLLRKLQDTPKTRRSSSKDMAATLAVLKDVNHVLAKIDKASFTVENARPSLERAFDYYAQLRSDDKFRDNLNSIEGYTLSHMLLSKVSNWEKGSRSEGQPEDGVSNAKTARN